MKKIEENMKFSYIYKKFKNNSKLLENHQEKNFVIIIQ